MTDNIKFSFVVYHTKISPQGIDAISGIYPDNEAIRWKERWKTFQQDYLPHASNYIELLFKSARATHPDCQCIVLTDLSTSFSLPNEVEIHRYDLDPDKPAYNRLLAQKQYLEASNDESHAVFLDYDMLIQQSLEQILTCDFDVALTHEPALNRINGSFIFIHKGRKEYGIRFFHLIEQIYLKHCTAYEAWGGIEASMNAFVHAAVSTIDYFKPYEIDMVKVMLLPTDNYNYPLTNQEMLFLDFMPNHMILHFRGDRKMGMIDYWNSYLKPGF